MTMTQEMAVPTAVAEFLKRIGTADWAGMEEHLDRDVLYDASVPGWHYQYQGTDRVLREYREEWSSKYRWTVVERHTVAADDAVTLLIEMHGTAIRAGEVGGDHHRLLRIPKLADGRVRIGDLLEARRHRTLPQNVGNTIGALDGLERWTCCASHLAVRASGPTLARGFDAPTSHERYAPHVERRARRGNDPIRNRWGTLGARE